MKKLNDFINLLITASGSHYILTLQENVVLGTVR
jgi:hypothetical protein